MLFSNESGWWWQSLLALPKDTLGSGNDSARLKWQLSLGELSAEALFNLPENYREKHLTRRTQRTQRGLEGKMDTRSLFWPKGGGVEWKVAPKKAGEWGQKDCCGEMAMLPIYSQRCNGHRWKSYTPYIKTIFAPTTKTSFILHSHSGNDSPSYPLPGVTPGPWSTAMLQTSLSHLIHPPLSPFRLSC